MITFRKQQRILEEWKEKKSVKVFNACDVGEMIQFLEQETDKNTFSVKYERGIFFIE